jgi:hypothetical protein
MPNSLALWLLWVCRDPQVCDVLGRRLAAPLANPRLGPERSRARCLPKATLHPFVGRCRAYGAWCKQALSYWELGLYVDAADGVFVVGGFGVPVTPLLVGNGEWVVMLSR